MTSDELRSSLVRTLEDMKDKAVDMGISGALSEEDLEVAQYGIKCMKERLK